ncbi:MAG: DUF4097 family beta strand repeat-containing protein [Eubacteriales bacterium]|nr:DUF4097 family beta strand repeat-containing protein [Eubacteriales bacterium]
MRKGVKVALIAAGICIVSGGILMGAGAAGGAGFARQGDGGRMAEEWSETDSFFAKLFPGSGYYSGREAEDGYPVYDGDFETQIESAALPLCLDAELGGHTLEILEGDGQEIFLEGSNCDRIQCYVRKDTLYVRDVGKWKKYLKTGKRELKLTVPAGTRWESAKLEVDMGLIRAERLEADETSLSTDMGSVEIGDLRTGGLEAETNMGSIELSGRVEGDVSVETGMGSVGLWLSQPKEDFNYTVSAEMGEVNLDGEDFDGLSREKSIENGADWEMELSTSMGSIDISFD